MVFLSLGFEFHAILGNCTNDSSLVKLHHIRLLCDTYLTFYTFVIYIKSSSINPPPRPSCPGVSASIRLSVPVVAGGPQRRCTGELRATGNKKTDRCSTSAREAQSGMAGKRIFVFPTAGAPLLLFAQTHGLHIHGMHLDKRRLQDVSDSKFRKLGCACLETAHNPLRLSAWRPQ